MFVPGNLLVIQNVRPEPILTKGGPFGSTESVAMNIYNEAYTNNRLGLGTAKAVIFFIVVAIITSLQVRFTKSKEVEA